MRWVLTLVALSLGVWYLTNKQRRDQLMDTAQDTVPQDVQARVKDATATASKTAQDVAATATEKAQGIAATMTEKAQGIARQASTAAGDAAANAQQASSGAADRAQQAVESAAQRARQAADIVTQGARQATDTAADTTQPSPAPALGDTESTSQTGATAPAATGPRDTQQAATAPSLEARDEASPAAIGGGVETDVATPPPSVHETIQAELADVDERVDSLRSQAEAPPDPAEKSAGEVFGAGAIAATDLNLTQAPATPREAETVAGGVEPLRSASKSEQSGAATSGDATSSEGARSTVGRTLTTDDTVVPEGKRPRPVAGEGTTTAAGGAVDTLSPIPGGGAATGAEEPLPSGLASGAPGSGGPAASSIAPSTPDSAESPMTGMETAPVVDRAAEVAERTSGQFVGNKKKRVFHPATSSDLPSENNRVYFETVEEATAAGFTPAPNEDLDDA